MTAPLPEYATLGADDLVTGEAVALDLPAAAIGSRVASGLIDMLITIVLLVALLFVFTAAVANTDGALLGAAP